ncbi:MAG: DUF4214 domain-containing protein [Huintestinicola sp.]|uniref:DUF4214 domain-containing protein n=1 Tax=Huintestinicola sp. TaxID=2981661 RepID=UPI003F0DF296
MKGKKILGAVPAVLALCMAMAPSAWAEDVVTIDAAHFPDTKFKTYVRSYDDDESGGLSQEELEGVTIINISGSNGNPNGYTSLKGIEYFTNLVYLDCSYNEITELDVSKNTALETLDCDNNQLTSIDVSKNTALISLNCASNQIRSIDVTNNTALESLWFYSNQLTSLNIGKNTELGDLYCYNNQLSSLDVSGCTALKYLDCSYNEITELDVSKNTALTTLKCFHNQMESLNVSGCTKLEYLYCGYIYYNSDGNVESNETNRITKLDISKNTALKKLFCCGNQLTSLDVSKNTFLTYMSCSGNKLTSLDVSGCTALKYLYCYTNKFTSLDVSGCSALEEIRCYDNQLTSLGVNGCSALKEIRCYDNQLTSLGLSGCSELEELYCQNNKLTKLDVSKNTALNWLTCSENQLTSLDVRNNTVLQSLFCDGNKLTSLDVSNNTYLGCLSCSYNKLTSLDVTNNTYLRQLSCSSNHLTSLDLSHNYNLGLVSWGDNVYSISIKNGSYPLSDLPGNFDPEMAYGWQGATYDSDTNSLKDFTRNTVTYYYDEGQYRFSDGIPFTLKVTNYVDPVSDFVERLYVNLLGRASDPRGKANHVNSLKSGRSACDVAKNFVLSTELANKKLSNKEFVTRMYKTMLDRNPDPTGLARWTAALDNGCSYGYVLQGFGKSAEFTRLCESYGVTRGSYTSPEYRDRNEKLTAYVSRLYTVALGRKYDIKGLNNHTGRYINGTKTAEEIAYSFVFSTEFKNKKLTDEQFVDCMYNSLFGRTADAGGKSRWLTKMKNGMTREQVFKGFASSAEFKNMVAKFGL